MPIEDLIDVLLRVNSRRDKPLDEDYLKQVIALVVKNPLDEDRSRCQQQIAKLVKDKVRGGTG